MTAAACATPTRPLGALLFERACLESQLRRLTGQLHAADAYLDEPDAHLALGACQRRVIRDNRSVVLCLLRAVRLEVDAWNRAHPLPA